MWDFSIGQALALMARTAPFVLFRVLVYFAVSAAFVVVTGTGAGIGYGVGLFGDEDFRTSATVYGAISGFGLTAGVIFFLRDYLLYLVKAGHLAVMVELMEGREVPGGQGQVAWAQGVVRERFGTASALFGLDVLIRGVVGAVTGLLQGILSFLPIPGLDRLAAALRAYLKIAAGLIDEVILAQILRTRSDNPWKTGQEALVLYAQNARPLLVNAAWLTLIVWVLSLLVFLVMLAPAAAVVWLIPGPATGGMMVFAILFAWAVKAALIEPFALACMLQVYFKVTEGQQPDPDWTARLSQASDKFRSMGEKAAGWVTGRRSAPPAA
ncbi:hypothetical protein [Pseudogemmobacter blasticus]|uniref:Uncharacterized protein n=1 Tax=Fuscovulum blasticum DSM 2131 TaxID=1188250 RepID=A0A2T4JA43_FUSBL|nr:hypothetical protein [Fuscovulum blasticum]PTE14698.1 hypothetical protein C5F44_07765 [Fuscovulum blasticum DSM 2131]